IPAATKLARHPSSAASVGSDTPASIDAAGMLASLIPNASPCRRPGTRSANARAAPVSTSATQNPTGSSGSARLHQPWATAAVTTAQTPASATPTRSATPDPTRSTIQPAGVASSDDDANTTVTTAPTAV